VVARNPTHSSLVFGHRTVPRNLVL